MGQFLYMTFGSTNATLKAEKALRGFDRSYRVVQKPESIRGACGLAVRVYEDDADAAMARLRAAGVPPRQQVLLPDPMAAR